MLAKTVSLELEPGNPASRKRIETQVLHYDVDTWRAYNYLWNDEQTDAVLQGPDGSDRAFKIKDEKAPGGLRQQTWHHAGRTECILCHTTRAGSIHGFRIPQLNRDHELRRAEPADRDGEPTRDVSIISAISPSRSPRSEIAWVDPHDGSAPLDARARPICTSTAPIATVAGRRLGSIRHSNHDADRKEHAPRHRGRRKERSTSTVPRCRTGDPWRSVLYYRMMKLGSGRMPQFGSKMVDDRGTHLILKWITSLGTAENLRPSC